MVYAMGHVSVCVSVIYPSVTSLELYENAWMYHANNDA